MGRSISPPAGQELNALNTRSGKRRALVIANGMTMSIGFHRKDETWDGLMVMKWHVMNTHKNLSAIVVCGMRKNSPL